MAGKAGLKAGLIGAAAAFILTFTGILPGLVRQVGALGCVCCLLPLLAYAGAGVLGGFFVPAPRDTGTGAGAGAIAGLLSGVGNTLSWMIITGLQMLITGTQEVASGLDPQTLDMLRETGMSPEMFTALSGVTGVFIGGGMCCLVSLALGAGLGALGGLIFASAKRD